MQISQAPRRGARLWLAALLAAGCANPLPLGPGATVELGGGEGLLVLHYTSNMGIESLTFGFVGYQRQIQDLPKGEHVLLLPVRAGSYRWKQLRMGWSPSPWTTNVRFPMRREKVWKFRVEPGRINYAGMLNLEFGKGSLRMYYRTVDRSAAALETLRKNHGELLDRYPIVYTGSGRNVFFDHYRRAVRGKQTADEPTAQLGSEAP